MDWELDRGATSPSDTAHAAAPCPRCNPEVERGRYSRSCKLYRCLAVARPPDGRASVPARSSRNRSVSHQRSRWRCIRGSEIRARQELPQVGPVTAGLWLRFGNRRRVRRSFSSQRYWVFHGKAAASRPVATQVKKEALNPTRDE